MVLHISNKAQSRPQVWVDGGWMGANGGEWRPLGENFVLGIAILRGDPDTAGNRGVTLKSILRGHDLGLIQCSILT